jgi:hypothetical protein
LSGAHCIVIVGGSDVVRIAVIGCWSTRGSRSARPAAVKRHRTSLKNPPKTVGEFLAILDKQQIPQTVLTLKNNALQI